MKPRIVLSGPARSRAVMLLEALAVVVVTVLVALGVAHVAERMGVL